MIGRILYEKFVNQERPNKGTYIHFFPTTTNIVFSWEEHEKDYLK